MVQLDETRVSLIDRMLRLMLWLDGRPMADVLMPFQKDIIKTSLATVRFEDLMLWFKDCWSVSNRLIWSSESAVGSKSGARASSDGRA